MTNQQPPPNAFSMDCARAQDILFDLQEAQMEAGSGIIVTAEDRSRLERHLTDCTHCRSYRQTMTNLVQSVNQLEPVPVPAGLEDRIIARISLEASVSKNVLPSGFQWKKYMPIAAAVLVLAVAIPLVMKSMTSNPDAPQVAQYTQDGPDNSELQPADLNELANLPEQIQPMNPSEHPMPEAMQAQPPNGYDNEPISQSMPMNGQPPHEQQQGNNRYAPSPDGESSQQRGGGNYAVDSSSLASALPPTTTGQLNETYASDDEGDVYYDPVSNLVGF